jgi:hypothetical protein
MPHRDLQGYLLMCRKGLSFQPVVKQVADRPVEQKVTEQKGIAVILIDLSGQENLHLRPSFQPLFSGDQ